MFPLLLALLAGKQMQLYFKAENYPWRDWARGGAVVHLVFAFVAAFAILLFGGISFSGEGFRAALGMAAAYWIFSLLGVIGLYGEKRDFALGGSLLAGVVRRAVLLGPGIPVPGNRAGLAYRVGQSTGGSPTGLRTRRRCFQRSPPLATSGGGTHYVGQCDGGFHP